MLKFTLNRWIGLFEDAWAAMIPQALYARFDVDHFMRTDTAGRYATYGQARTFGLMSTNEIRVKENMPPVPGGDDINAPLNSASTSLGGDPANPIGGTADPGASTPKSAAESGATI
jgi:phage portal protein BeeE